MNVDNINLLPEIQLEILSRVELDDLNNCTQVCKLWNQLSSSEFIWKPIWITRYPEFETIENVVFNKFIEVKSNKEDRGQFNFEKVEKIFEIVVDAYFKDSKSKSLELSCIFPLDSNCYIRCNHDNQGSENFAIYHKVVVIYDHLANSDYLKFGLDWKFGAGQYFAIEKPGFSAKVPNTFLWPSFAQYIQEIFSEANSERERVDLKDIRNALRQDLRNTFRKSLESRIWLLESFEKLESRRQESEKELRKQKSKKNNASSLCTIS